MTLAKRGPRSRPKKSKTQSNSLEMKRLRNKADDLFSKLIREAWQYHCARCGKADGRMECSHIFSRRHARTRWDTDNAKCLCSGCHRWWHENPVESGAWARSLFGDGFVDLLNEKRNSVFRWTVTELRALVEHLQTERVRIEAMREAGEQGFIRPTPYD